MGRSPCCTKVGLNRGQWTSEEDAILAKYIETHGEGSWRCVPKSAGLLRCGKSCRLRWVNYLRPSVKRGNISEDEENLIMKLHFLLGNRWSLIAGRMPGRTDNEIKNYWNTHLSRKLKSLGIDPNTHKPMCTPQNNQVAEDRSTDNYESPSVFQLQNSASDGLEETSQNINSTEVPSHCDNVFHGTLTSEEGISVETVSSSTKLISNAEMVNRPISRIFHAGFEGMEQNSIFGMDIDQHQRKSMQQDFISVKEDIFTLNWSSPSSVLCTDYSSSSKCDSPSSFFTTSNCCEDQFMNMPPHFTPPQLGSNELQQPINDFSTLQPTEKKLDHSPTSLEFFQDTAINFMMPTNGPVEYGSDRLNMGINSGHADQLISILDNPEAGEFWDCIRKQEVANYSQPETPLSRTNWWDGFEQIIRSSEDDQSPKCNTNNDHESFMLNFPDMYELELESSRRPLYVSPAQYLDEYCENLYLAASFSKF